MLSKQFMYFLRSFPLTRAESLAASFTSLFFVNEQKPVYLFIYFLGRETEISFTKKFLAADELRSHMIIPLGDKSCYDLILKINEKA